MEAENPQAGGAEGLVTHHRLGSCSVHMHTYTCRLVPVHRHVLLALSVSFCHLRRRRVASSDKTAFLSLQSYFFEVTYLQRKSFQEMEKQANNISCEVRRWNRSSEIKFYFLIWEGVIQDTGSCAVYVTAAPPTKLPTVSSLSFLWPASPSLFPPGSQLQLLKSSFCEFCACH